jgi:helix-hairpin-helix protein
MRTVRNGFFFLLVAGALICGSAPLTVSARQAGSKAAASGAKVDLNTASEKDLEDLPGVGPATAKKIIAGRPYSSVDGLSKAGVPARTIGKISSLVTVSGAAAAAPAPAAAPKSTAKASAPVSQPAPAAAAPSQPPPPATPSKPAPAATASQGSPGAGMVWVNLETGVYHYQSSRYYGKTKSGKYMSEADAIKAGYHAAKNEKKS